MMTVFKKLTAILLCLLGSHLVHADHLLKCPAVETLSSYTYGVALPYAYNQNVKKTQFVSVALEPTRFGDDARAGLVVYPLSVSFEEEPETKMKALISQLVLETPNPINYRIAARETLPLCIYTVPGNNVTAFLFKQDGEDSEEHIFNFKSQKNMSRSKQAMSFLKLIHWS